MGAKAAITVRRPREELERLWGQGEARRTVEELTGEVSFRDAPGDRGTEIHVELPDDARGGIVSQAIGHLHGDEPLARVKDALRRFKQIIETGEVPRSDAVPHGESEKAKLHQRPAQPLNQNELQKVGV